MSPRSCDGCGQTFVPVRSRARYCSRACAGVAPNTAETIWRFIAKAGPRDCWEWQGTRDQDGYGRISVQRKTMAAHRLAFELGHGVSADGLHVCHSCDNPGCCNPAHLFLGTNTENHKDKVSKGRQACGEQANSVLTDHQVRKIRRLAATGVFQREIALRFGISQPNVGYICRRDTWRHVA
jgi:hypothetical protein